MKNLLVAQSGGPSSAINATLAGAVQYALTNSNVDKIYGAQHGIEGVLKRNLIEIGDMLKSPANMDRLVHSPSSALGSCRFKLGSPEDKPEQYKSIFECFREFNIGYFVYIGGNDSMDTVAKLSKYAKENGYDDVNIMGGPKTIDNDLRGMDHSPGYASAAKYIATTIAELWQDCRVYDIPTVTIVEIMGRHAGWLAAASAMARETCAAPHLIYLPEMEFSNEKFVADVKAQLEKSTVVMVCIGEGIKYANGTFVSEDGENSSVDAFGHKKLTGAAKSLEGIIQREIGCKVRSIDFSLIQRCAAHVASETDLAESKILGSMAAEKAISGVSGQVPVLNRISSNPYKVEYSSVPVEEIANKEKVVPAEWINADANFVTKEFIEYLKPLVGADKDDADMFLGKPAHINFLDK